MYSYQNLCHNNSKDQASNLNQRIFLADLSEIVVESRNLSLTA